MANRRFEYAPQLLNSIDEAAMLEYIRDPDWVMQEKMDGVRLIVVRRGNSITAGNRNGLTVAVSSTIVEAVLALDHDCVLEGEAIGDVYWPFDLLSFDGNCIKGGSLTYRLANLHRHTQGEAIEVWPRSHRVLRTRQTCLAGHDSSRRRRGCRLQECPRPLYTGTARLRRRCSEAQIQG